MARYTLLAAEQQEVIELILNHVKERAALVQDALLRHLAIFSDANRYPAPASVAAEAQVNEVGRRIDRLCREFIANQQPTASALRFVYAAIKVNSAIEQLGRHAQRVARQLLETPPLGTNVSLASLDAIAQKAVPTFEEAVVAFVEQDPQRARSAVHVVGELEHLRHQLAVELARKQQTDELPLDALVPLFAITSLLERTVDQAKSICQEVLYLFSGHYFRNKGNEAVRVLFVDDDNGCVSQMAEAIGTSLGKSLFVFSSAGLDRKPVDVGVVKYLAERGLDISSRTSKLLDEVPHLEHYQLIVALTPNARRVFPPGPTKTICLDWSAMDSIALPNTTGQTQPDYCKLYESLLGHVKDLVDAVVIDCPAQSTFSCGA